MKIRTQFTITVLLFSAILIAITASTIKSARSFSSKAEYN